MFKVRNLCNSILQLKSDFLPVDRTRLNQKQIRICRAYVNISMRKVMN